MATTSLRMPEALKARINRLAEQTGISPHAFMLEAITEKAAAEERREDFLKEAETRHTRLLASGESLAWDDMRRYLAERAEGQIATRPTPRKMAGT